MRWPSTERWVRQASSVTKYHGRPRAVDGLLPAAPDDTTRVGYAPH